MRLCQRRKCSHPLELHTPECEGELEIWDADDNFVAFLLRNEPCKCVGFLELEAPREFEIVDEKNRRIHSV